MRTHPFAKRVLGTVDTALAIVLASLCIALGLIAREPVGIALGVAACLGAALAVRWPHASSIALGVVLAVYAFAPNQLGQIGQYAPLIAVLGAGMRGKRQLRFGMALGFWLVHVAALFIAYGNSWTSVFRALIWTALTAMIWAIGDTFSAYRNAQHELRAAALTQQRLSLARELHDSLSRTLVRLSLQARAAAAANDPSALNEIADGIGQASSELRWLLSALREPDATVPTASSGSLAARMTQLLEQLDERGFPVTMTVDGDLDTVPPGVAEVVATVANEAMANVERHGVQGRPSSLLASVDADSLDLAVVNEIAAHSQNASARSMGLLGAAERLATVGGSIESRPEGSRWITRITVPLGATR